MLHVSQSLREEKELGKAILKSITTQSLGRSVLYVDQCTSTNQVAKEIANKGTIHGFTVIANSQSDARGRNGRTWVSPNGGIWMTIVLQQEMRSTTLQCLPLIGALSIVECIRNLISVDVELRWPNDVVFRGQKLAGTIAETYLMGDSPKFSLLGIGVNVNFKSNAITDTNMTATTLLDIRGSNVNRVDLTCSILEELEKLLSLTETNEKETLALIRKVDYSTGRKVKIRLQDRTINGVIKGYTSLTNVCVESDSGTGIVVDAASAELVSYV